MSVGSVVTRALPFTGGLIASGMLTPTSLVEQLVGMSLEQLKTGAFGDLVLLVGAPPNDATSDDRGRFLGELERSVLEGRGASTDSGGWLSTSEFPTLGVEPGDANDADQVELLAELGSAPHGLVPLLPRDGGASILLGRAPGSDVLLADASVSSRHASIRLKDGGVRLEDLGSKNGTHVNGVPLLAGEPHWLQPMDRITLGRISAFACLPRTLRAVLRQDLRAMF